MIKTNTAPKKSTAKKAAPKKSAPKKAPVIASGKATPKTVATKKSTPVSQKATTVAKKTAPKKKTPVKKIVSQVVEKITPDTAPAAAKKSTSSSWKEGIKVLGVIYLLGWIIAIVIYYLFQNNKFSSLEREVYFDIVNFWLSFLIYFFAFGFLFWSILAPLIVYIVLKITWFLRHLRGEKYSYPFVFTKLNF